MYGLATAFAKQELVAHHTRQRRALREGLSHYHLSRGFLNAVLAYCKTAERLADGVAAVGARARGLTGCVIISSATVTGRRFAAPPSAGRSRHATTAPATRWPRCATAS